MCQLNSKGKHMGDFIITGKVDVLFVQMVIILSIQIICYSGSWITRCFES